MASFEQAFAKTMGHEGGHANSRLDLGGETYRGISRRWWPHWPGWRIVDRLQKEAELEGDAARLNLLVEDFYRANFWNRVKGDLVPEQSIAEELFDTAVNLDAVDAIVMLQRGCNALNKKERRHRDLVADGKFGRKTLDALTAHCESGGAPRLFQLLNILQGAHYIEETERDPKQRHWLGGWLGRVILKWRAA